MKACPLPSIREVFPDFFPPREQEADKLPGGEQRSQQPTHQKKVYGFECQGCQKTYTARFSLDRHWEGYPYCEALHLASELNREQREFHAMSLERRQKRAEKIRHRAELRQSRRDTTGIARHSQRPLRRV